jgi:hypothetical protein
VTEWKLVPVEPTPEMVLAGVKGQSNRVTVPRDDELATGHYYDMLAAAPEPPADPRDGEIARLRKLVEELASDLQAEVESRYCDGSGNLVHPSYQRRYERDMEPVIRANAALRGEDA